MAEIMHKALAMKASASAQTPRDFVQDVPMSLSTFWAKVAAGKIRVIRIGRKVLVPDAEKQRILEEGC